MEMNQKNKQKKLRRLCLKQPKIKMQLQENHSQVADFTTARMEVRRQLNIMFKSLRNYNCQSRAKQNSGMRVKKKRLSAYNIQNQTKDDFAALDSYQINYINMNIRIRQRELNKD